MRKIVVVFSDTHGGHGLALMNPDVALYATDERGNITSYTPRATETQAWLWDCYRQDIASVKELAKGKEIIVIHNGDITWGRAHPEGIISTREADQREIAMGNMEPWAAMKNVHTMRLIHGTQSHEFGEGSSSIEIAKRLKEKYPKRNIGSVRHGIFDIDGVMFDCAHHGAGPGTKAWTTGNSVKSDVQSLMLKEIIRGQRPPDVMVRSHYHALVHETVRVGDHTTEGFVTPGYCGMTHYAAQATRSSFMLSIGLIAFVIENGKLVDIQKFTREVDLRTGEKL